MAIAVLRFDGAPAHFREFRRGAPARLSMVSSQICQALDPAGGLGVAGTYCLNGRPSISLLFQCANRPVGRGLEAPGWHRIGRWSLLNARGGYGARIARQQ